MTNSKFDFTYRLLLLFFLILHLSACHSVEERDDPAFRQWLDAHPGPFDLCLLNGTIYNGRDTLPFRGDVLLRGDSIAFIGQVDTSLIRADQVIEVGEKVICPGFIDTHAHGDPLETPEFQNFLAMGVTTIFLGQDGGSPSVTDIKKWMKKVDEVQPGVNIGLLTGHGSLRQASGAGYDPQPTVAALDSMQQLLRQTLEAGAFGLSTGLEYTPGSYAGDEELLSLARIVGEYKGIIMSHVRNEDEDAIEASLAELLRQGRHCNVHAAHLKVVYGKGRERAEAILAKLEAARQGPYSVTADVYPYTASYTGIGIVFPEWAKPPHDYEQVKKQNRSRLLAFLRDKVTARNGPEATLFGTPPYAGKTLAQLSEEQQRPFEEILLDIGPGGASAAYFVMDEELQARLLADPQVMICSDGSPGMRHPRGYGSFARIIQQYVLEEQRFSLGEAIRKMTSLPAQTLGLDKRGLLKEGNKADLLVFDPTAIRAHATFEQPHQLATGFEWVIVNGKAAVVKGQIAKTREGKILRKLPSR